MATYDGVDGILTQHQFGICNLDDSGPETEAVYRRENINPRRYVTVPCNPGNNIPDNVVHQIMRTANIPYEDYKDIVESEPPSQ